jgi:hypothetical protein
MARPDILFRELDPYLNIGDFCCLKYGAKDSQ